MSPAKRLVNALNQPISISLLQRENKEKRKNIRTNHNEHKIGKIQQAICRHM
jgi:hypothetical protein